MKILPNNDSKLFDLKPQMTLAMKLAASFAITYYGMLLLYNIFAVIFYKYSLDSYYLQTGEAIEGLSSDIPVLIFRLIISTILVYSLIQIFRKKMNGKIIFAIFTLVLVASQLITTGYGVWYKYAIEILLLLIIVPLNIKKKRKQKSAEPESPTTVA